MYIINVTKQTEQYEADIGTLVASVRLRLSQPLELLLGKRS